MSKKVFSRLFGHQCGALRHEARRRVGGKFDCSARRFSDMLGDSLVYGFSLYVLWRSAEWKAVAALLAGRSRWSRHRRIVLGSALTVLRGIVRGTADAEIAIQNSRLVGTKGFT